MNFVTLNKLLVYCFVVGPLFIVLILQTACSETKDKIPVETASIYLTSTDSTRTSHEIKFLKNHRFILDVSFISKEDAMKIYLADSSNQDWSEVLDHNPLPASYKILLNTKNMRVSDTATFRRELETNIRTFEHILYDYLDAN